MASLRAQQAIGRSASFLVSELLGSIISLIYAFHIDKLPIILGFVFLPFIYARNLRFLRLGQSATSPTGSGA